MSKQGETRLQKRIRKAIEVAYPTAFVFKVHGSMFQASGIPDLMCCILGYYIALEVKMPQKGKVSDVQEETIDDILRAQGCAAVVESPKEALEVIKNHLEDNDWTVEPTSAAAKERRRVRGKRKNVRSVLQTKARKDIHRTRRRREARS